MKKNFKFMLVALIAFFGYNSAFAQLPAEITMGNFVYENVTVTDAANKKATATIKEIAPGKSIVDETTKVLDLGDGELTYVNGSAENTWKIQVLTFNPAITQGQSTAVSVTIPKEFVSIPVGAFYNCSNLYTITFEGESKVETIGTHAFATTQIAEFDFSPCTSLQALPDEVFVEPGQPNTFITKVKVPTGPLFKHINGAFQNLTALTEIEGLGDSWIQEVIEGAFDGCEALTTLSLPGKNLKYIDHKALMGSKIATLTIDLGSIVMLGGGHVENDYTFTPDGTEDYNIYGDDAIDLTPLSSLTLKNTTGVGTGSLTGKICSYAFAYCDKINSVLDLSSVTFGSTAQIEGNAFANCYDGTNTTGIKGVTIGNITDNQSGDYTIDDNAFDGCDYLATVTINNITTAKAIGVAAFGENLKTVSIGTVKADDQAFAAGAFVWANVAGAELKLAQGAGQYLNANNVTIPLIPAGVFDMSAITTATTMPVIKIGEIRSLGGVFEDGAITSPKGVSELTFTGAIAANGLDAAIFSANLDLTAITFKGAIGAAGIATDAFSNLAKITTLTFEGKLVENAVDAGAFAIVDDGTSAYALNYTYTYTSSDDYTVNPFNVNAMNAGAAKVTDRFITLNVTDTKLLPNYQDPVKGINGTGADPTKFDIYLVEFAVVNPELSEGFLVYRNKNQKSMAWGRYDLGNFALEQGPDNDADGFGDYYNGGASMITNGMIIDRLQTIGEQQAKLTLYGLYTDEDPIGEESSIYMIPLQVFHGQYHIIAGNTQLIIVKAETLDGSDFADEDVLVDYDDVAPANDSYWAGLLAAPQMEKATDFHTNQQLWDKTWVSAGYTWNDKNIWEDYDGVEQETVQNHLWIMTDPAKHNGFRVDKTDIKKGTEGKGARIDKGWWFALLQNFGKPASASPARIVWLDEAQATAIYGVKEVKNVEEGAIYNLQGVRVSNPTKGLYIQNGKKFIVK